MKKSRVRPCAAKGVKDIVQIKIGFDGIVVATDKDGADYNFKTERPLPGPGRGGAARRRASSPTPTRPGTRSTRACPSKRIQVYGPPPTSGTRDAFVELAMEAGARKYPHRRRPQDNEDQVQDPDPPAARGRRWVDAGENDNAIVQTLTRTPGSLGVFGFSFLEQNMDKVKAATIDGVAPYGRDHRRRLLSAVAQPLHLRQEGPRRRDAGPGGVRRGVHVRRGHRPRRLPAGPRPGPAARRPTDGRTRQGRRHDLDGPPELTGSAQTRMQTPRTIIVRGVCRCACNGATEFLVNHVGFG